jgi:AraC-like DNA-binding protein
VNSGYSIQKENISFDYFADSDSFQQINGDHCHQGYEITYILSASGRYIVEGSEHMVTGGTLLLISPLSYHRVELDTDAPVEIFSLHFGRNALPDTVISLLDRITDNDSSRGTIYPPSLVFDELANCFDRFSVASRLGDSEAEAYMQAILAEMVILLSAAEGERMNNSGEELGARVARYLNSNIEKNINLDKLARRFFVSKFHLCRAFKSYSGTSVHSYVNQKRIIHAKSLIESGLTASGAAERVGFGDYSAFYRAYIKVVGKSPTAE